VTRKSSSRCTPERLVAYTTAHAIAPVAHPRTSNSSTVGKNVNAPDATGPTCVCVAGTDNEIALAFSIAITTAPKITVINTAVALEMEIQIAFLASLQESVTTKTTGHRSQMFPHRST
jgi:hypothetical protein